MKNARLGTLMVAIIACLLFAAGCVKPGYQNRAKSRKLESRADTYEKKAKTAEKKAEKHYSAGECDPGLKSGQEAVNAWADRRWAMCMSNMADRFAYAEERAADGFLKWQFDLPVNPGSICKRDRIVAYRQEQDINLYEYSKCDFKNNKKYSYINREGLSSKQLVAKALVKLKQKKIVEAYGSLIPAALMGNPNAAYFLGHLYLQMKQGDDALYWFTVARHLTTDSKEKLGLYEEKWGEIVADAIGYNGMSYSDLDLKGRFLFDSIQFRLPISQGAVKKNKFVKLWDASRGLCTYRLAYTSARLKTHYTSYSLANAESINKAIVRLKKNGKSQDKDVKAMLSDLQHLDTLKGKKATTKCKQYCTYWMKAYFQPEVDYWFKLWKPALENSASKSKK